ncbi:hypothetical protein JKG47_10065 [Acidithiobacillus sp. MC6.1]|nr:hypothetical protein [Acidithiobacillus sp. MC6.1]
MSIFLAAHRHGTPAIISLGVFVMLGGVLHASFLVAGMISCFGIILMFNQLKEGVLS